MVAGAGAAGLAASCLLAVANVMLGPAADGGERTRSIPWFVVFYAGLTLLVAAWAALAIPLRRSGVTPRTLTTMLAAWSAPLMFGRPFLSRDMYSYAAQGRLVAAGLNPYHVAVAALPDRAFVAAVSPLWQHTPAPYGPAFLSLAGFVVARVRGVSAAVEALRAVNLAGVIAIAVLVPRIAKRHGVDPASAVWLGVLNPLVVLHLVGGGHNEALMIALLLAALAAASEGHEVAAAALVAGAATIKAPAAAALVVLVVETLSRRPLHATWRRALAQVLAAAGVFAAITRMSGLGFGWLRALGTADAVRSVTSVTTTAGMLAGGLAHFLGFTPDSSSWAISIARAAGVLAAAAVSARVLFASPGRRARPSVASPAGDSSSPDESGARCAARGNPTRRVGLVLLAVVALGPVVQPWYLLWALPLLAAGGAERLEPPLVAVSLAAAFVVMPSGSAVADPVAVVALVAVAATVVVSATSRRPARAGVERSDALTVP